MYTENDKSFRKIARPQTCFYKLGFGSSRSSIFFSLSLFFYLLFVWQPLSFSSRRKQDFVDSVCTTVITECSLFIRSTFCFLTAFGIYEFTNYHNSILRKQLSYLVFESLFFSSSSFSFSFAVTFGFACIDMESQWEQYIGFNSTDRSATNLICSFVGFQRLFSWSITIFALVIKQKSKREIAKHSKETMLRFGFKHPPLLYLKKSKNTRRKKIYESHHA